MTGKGNVVEVEKIPSREKAVLVLFDVGNVPPGNSGCGSRGRGPISQHHQRRPSGTVGW